MQLWRISNYASLSGEGGLYFEGRWHTIGLPILYLAASPAGAMIEILVHLELDEGPLPTHYQLLQVSTPDYLPVENLAPDHSFHQVCTLELAATRAFGTAWLKSGRTALAQVPSAILPATSNYLLNPSHPDASLLKIEAVLSAAFDPRFFRSLRG